MPAIPQGAREAVADGIGALGCDLYAALRQDPDNLFFSPYSIATALAMTYAGARGETAAQMARTLRMALEPASLHAAFGEIAAGLEAGSRSGDNQLHTANGLFPEARYAFLDEFSALLKEHYGAESTPMDYQHHPETASKKVNAWVAKQTQGKIRDLIPVGLLGPLTRLVLANAIYFKGTWAWRFPKRATENAPFRTGSQSSLQVAMMSQTERFPYCEDDNLQVLELPYVGESLGMVLLLPRSVDGLASLEQSLTWPRLQAWLAGLVARKVQVFLPRFKLDSRCRLAAVLQHLGMIDAFDMNKADFSGMDGRRCWLYISAVLHQAFVKVDEQGTEAAAATAVAASLRAPTPPPPPVFRADHPFVFLIRDKSTGSILFLGRVKQP